MDIDVMDGLFGALLAILCAEAIAWLPRLTKRIVRTAANRLGGDLRERMEEEWLRYVNDFPGTFGAFAAACQCLFASTRIRPVHIRFDLKTRFDSYFKPPDIVPPDGKTLRRFTIPAPGSFDVIVVTRGDSLSKIARDRLGDVKRWKEIFAMNRDKLGAPDRIYCGMTLRTPKA